MLEIWDAITAHLSIFGIPPAQIILVLAILLVVIVLRGLFLQIIIKRLEVWTSRTNTTLDDELIALIRQPLGWLVFLVGFWLIHLVISGHLNPEVNQAISGVIGLGFVGTITLIVYRAAPLLGVFLSQLSTRTRTEIDDIIVPYLPLFFRTIATVVFLIKAGEVLLGASATAIIGLIGGAGITFGLLFKDIVADWFATIVIYSDSLYKPGDYLIVPEIPSGHSIVVSIGIRSTKLLVTATDSIQRIPNSQMITGRVENWTQNAGDTMSIGINVIIKIDNIASAQAARICQALREIPQAHEFFNKKSVIWFSGFEGNARVINVRVFVNDMAFFRSGWTQLNLDILKILETEGIDLLQVYIRTDPEGYQNWQAGNS